MHSSLVPAGRWVKILPMFRPWCSGFPQREDDGWSSSLLIRLRIIFALKKSGASHLKSRKDFHSPSSWHQKPVYPTCVSNLRSPTSCLEVYVWCEECNKFELSAAEALPVYVNAGAAMRRSSMLGRWSHMWVGLRTYVVNGVCGGGTVLCLC